MRPLSSIIRDGVIGSLAATNFSPMLRIQPSPSGARWQYAARKMRSAPSAPSAAHRSHPTANRRQCRLCCTHDNRLRCLKNRCHNTIPRKQRRRRAGTERKTKRERFTVTCSDNLHRLRRCRLHCGSAAGSAAGLAATAACAAGLASAFGPAGFSGFSASFGVTGGAAGLTAASGETARACRVSGVTRSTT